MPTSSEYFSRALHAVENSKILLLTDSLRQAKDLGGDTNEYHISLEDYRGMTLLMYAASQSKNDMIPILLTKGANPNIIRSDDNPMTASSYALLYTLNKVDLKGGLAELYVKKMIGTLRHLGEYPTPGFSDTEILEHELRKNGATDEAGNLTHAFSNISKERINKLRELVKIGEIAAPFAKVKSATNQFATPSIGGEMDILDNPLAKEILGEPPIKTGEKHPRHDPSKDLENFDVSDQICSSNFTLTTNQPQTNHLPPQPRRAQPLRLMILHE